MADNDVLVTGIGVVSSLGSGVENFWKGLSAGRSVPRPYPTESRYMRNRLMYYVDGPDDGPSGHGRAARFGINACQMALRDAGLAPDGASIGLAIGTGMGQADRFDAVRDGRSLGGAPSFTFDVASVLATAMSLSGPSYSVSTACSASAYAISLAADAIRRRETDLMLAGGTEGFARVALGCFNRLGALDSVVCRPFDARRGGTLFGEGAALLVLESAASACRRRAPHCYASIKGWGWSCDGHHPTAPDPSGIDIVLAMKRSLEDAEMTADEVDAVIPHGTGTELNDVVESEALAMLLGERVNEVPLCPIKAMIGHTGGAAGAFAVLTAALVISRGLLPPVGSPETPDSRCRVRLPRTATVGSFGAVLVNAYAFGGNNASLVIGRTT